MELARPDYPSRSLEGLARIFEFFGEVECPQLDARIYAALCREIRHDGELLAMAAHAPTLQPPPNLLFGAVHYLLLGGEQHELREWYPTLTDGEARDPETIFPAFRDFCLAHRKRIEGLIETRLTQTNVVQRCSGLLPAFAEVYRAGGNMPLALVEIGVSAGLNLQWDRFHYRYDDVCAWGDPASSVRIECELRGDVPLPSPPREIPVVWRRGIDIHPIDISDPDAVRWLRALVWPDHAGRQERLSAAIDLALSLRPPVLAGDAALLLPRLMAEAPTDATLCVYGTHTLYQFPREVLLGVARRSEAPIPLFQIFTAANPAGEEAASEGAVGDEPDPQLVTGGEDSIFRIARPQRVLRLDGGDGMDAVARRRVSAETSERPRRLTRPARTNSAMAPTVSSMATSGSRRCR